MARMPHGELAALQFSEGGWRRFRQASAANNSRSVGFSLIDAFKLANHCNDDFGVKLFQELLSLRGSGPKIDFDLRQRCQARLDWELLTHDYTEQASSPQALMPPGDFAIRSATPGHGRELPRVGLAPYSSEWQHSGPPRPASKRPLDILAAPATRPKYVTRSPDAVNR
eukprot:1878878-Heterocapsa_arctica.AAC.1